MNKANIIKALEAARKQSKKRKFSQTFDFIVVLKGLNMKKPEDQVEFFMTMPHSIDKKKKVCALVGPELKDKALESCDKVITQDEFEKFKDKKELKKIAAGYDFFLAQADIMPKVAATFGRALGPRGKMPNPKAGCILPPKAAVTPVYEKLQKTAKIVAKKQLAIQVPVGNEDMKDEDIAENISTVYNQIVHHLPQEQNNIKGTFVKLTMGTPVELRR